MSEILNIKDCAGICGIYKINFPNNKSYIGKAVDIKDRMKDHNSPNSQQIVDKAIRKYFGKIVTIEILERVNDKTDISLLNEKEKYWIAFYHTYEDKDKGYNLTPGGDGAATGVNNVSAKLSQKELNEIYDLLLNSDLFIYQIAEKYNISKESISDINCGKRYFNDKLNYPLRKPKSGIKKGVENHLSKFSQEEIDEIYDLLEKHNEYSLQEIAEKKNVCYGTISKINRGLEYSKENYIYPIRKRSANCKLSIKEIDEIYELLKETNLSLKKIGSLYNVSQDTIIRINKGITYNKENYIYPIRKKKGEQNESYC